MQSRRWRTTQTPRMLAVSASPSSSCVRNRPRLRTQIYVLRDCNSKGQAEGNAARGSDSARRPEHRIAQSALHQFVELNLDDDSRIEPNDIALTPSALARRRRQQADALA